LHNYAVFVLFIEEEKYKYKLIKYICLLAGLLIIMLLNVLWEWNGWTFSNKVRGKIFTFI